MKNSILVLLMCLAGLAARAEEGMWTFDNPPRAAIKQAYGVEVTDAWLKRLRLATIRLEQGCTASFVSREGLILTNHHCAESCIAENSTSERDLLAGGFKAATREQELRCQAQAASVLVDMQNVTDAVQAAVKGLPDAEANSARKKELTRLEQGCEDACEKGRRDRSAEVRDRDALPGRPVLALQVQALSTSICAVCATTGACCGLPKARSCCSAPSSCAISYRSDRSFSSATNAVSASPIPSTVNT